MTRTRTVKFAVLIRVTVWQLISLGMRARGGLEALYHRALGLDGRLCLAMGFGRGLGLGNVSLRSLVLR